MSRCFPFPPPGYEKKARTDDDGNLLIKENHKEVKYKKDKKDKVKKDKKERREKEGRREKRKEKKDKKNKHKTKEKTREEETKKASSEKKLFPSDLKCGEKLNSTKDLPVQADSKFLFELEKRIRNGNEQRQIQIANRVSAPDSAMVSLCKLLESNSQILVKGCPKFNNERKATNFSSENSFCLNASGLQNGFVCNLGKDRNDLEGVIIQRDISGNQINGKDEIKHKKSGPGTRDKRKDGSKEKRSTSKDKKRKKEEAKEGGVKEVFVSTWSTLRENDNYGGDNQEDRSANLFERMGANNGHLDKRKEAETKEVLHGIENLNGLPRFVTSSRVLQNGSNSVASDTGIQPTPDGDASTRKAKLNIKVLTSNSSLKNGRKSDLRQTTFDLATERQQGIPNHRKIGNGHSLLHPTLAIGKELQDTVNDIMVNGTASSTYLVSENGRKLDSTQQSSLFSSESQSQIYFCNPNLGGPAAVVADVVGLEKKNPGVCPRPPSTIEQLKKPVERSTEPPHPDTKYLNEILSVPQIEVPVLDDQAWLFTSINHPAKKPKTDSTSSESKHVWAAAVHIDSLDVTALPYVVPY